MGLDITAYTGLKEVRQRANDDDYGDDDNLVWLYPGEGYFSERFGSLKENSLYSAEDSFGFRAGSYSGYNHWRDWLAGLVGTTPEAVWDGAQPPAFRELIDFSDCEGTIGPEVAAKLAKDFADYDEKAKAADNDDGFMYQRYQHWRKAFEMAAKNGAVKFH